MIKKIRISTYSPSISTTKKARKILVDLLNLQKVDKVCVSCDNTNFVYDKVNYQFICNNIDCKNKSCFLDILHVIKLNEDQKLRLIEMIIDMLNLDEISEVLKIQKSKLKVIYNIFIEKINWSKYKLDKDNLDVREIYASIDWSWN